MAHLKDKTKTFKLILRPFLSPVLHEKPGHIPQIHFLRPVPLELKRAGQKKTDLNVRLLMRGHSKVRSSSRKEGVFIKSERKKQGSNLFVRVRKWW